MVSDVWEHEWLQGLLCELIEDAHRRGDAGQFPVLAERVATAVNRSLGFDPAGLEDAARTGAEILGRDSYLPLGRLVEPAQVAAIQAYLADRPARAPFLPDKPFFAQDSIPDDVNFLDFDRADVITCPHVLDILNHPRVLSLVSAQLGGLPTLHCAIIRRSYAGRAVARENQLFHSDPWHCLRFVKLFIYLSDVDDAAGPHVYVRGSHDAEDLQARIQARVAAHPADAGRFDILLTSERKPDSVVADFFDAKDIVAMPGPAGTAFIGNTRALHKGRLPDRGDRLALIGLYGLLPGLRPALRGRPLSGADYAAHHRETYGEGLFSNHLSYINRMLTRWE
ncbi:phytanoyl-CoA dioxygenase family protein [Magnetospirillum sp. 64-120]|uniref:phytanoyl-CoA dioxygenase family protein n=1 Tax=Magnetospirillum sp. 64-120 TaxID=1895778 RepID=UPI000929FE65|nr:phytanoyl-CoA dioxygenase family protein [Magnetospirillum sp. 64-120]OJX70356.1 MAG: hypothetical protein BGO92_17345 [Magnetospirillum sp. 64-120]